MGWKEFWTKEIGGRSGCMAPLLTGLMCIPVCVMRWLRLPPCCPPGVLSCIILILKSYPKITVLRLYHTTDQTGDKSLFKP